MSTADLKATADKKLKKNSKNTGKLFEKLDNWQFLGTKVFISGGFDIILMILVFSLLTVGLVMMFSASYVSAKYDSSVGNDAFHYIKKQAIFAVVGVIFMFICSHINPELYKKLSPVIFAFSFVLLVVVLFAYKKIDGKESFKRWLPIPIIGGTFQPSDIAKLGVIMAIAYVFSRYKKKIEKIWWLSPVIFGCLAFVCILIYLEHHLSCTVLVMLVGLGMMFLGGVDRRWFVIGITLAIVFGTIIIVFRHQLLPTYQAERFDSLFVKDYDDTNDRWQTNQSLFALGSGGFFGLGLGNSIQKYLYMPEPQNDFIFAIVGEELGFFRSSLILLVFAMLFFRGFTIGIKSNNMYERLLVFGITLHIGLQTAMNILVVTDMIPNTGISLPFFSYGGTALMMQLIEMGMVLSVSRTGERKLKKNAEPEQ